MAISAVVILAGVLALEIYRSGNEITKTDWYAFFALVISAGALALEIRRWCESGVKLKLRCGVDFFVMVDGEKQIGVNQHHIYVEVSNRGDTLPL